MTLSLGSAHVGGGMGVVCLVLAAVFCCFDHLPGWVGSGVGLRGILANMF